MEILTCPLCCASGSTDNGTVFARGYDHKPGDDGVVRAFEVIEHHAVHKCSECGCAWIHGPGVKVPAELVAGVMRRNPQQNGVSL